MALNLAFSCSFNIVCPLTFHRVYFLKALFLDKFSVVCYPWFEFPRSHFSIKSLFLRIFLTHKNVIDLIDSDIIFNIINDSNIIFNCGIPYNGSRYLIDVLPYVGVYSRSNVIESP